MAAGSAHRRPSSRPPGALGRHSDPCRQDASHTNPPSAAPYSNPTASGFDGGPRSRDREGRQWAAERPRAPRVGLGARGLAGVRTVVSDYCVNVMPSGLLVALTSSTVREPLPTSTIALVTVVVAVVLILTWTSTRWVPGVRLGATKLK